MIVSALILLLSVVLPVGIVWWSVNSAVRGKPFRRPSAEYRQYAEGCVRNGELWFPVWIYSGGWRSHRIKETRIKRLNLTTGLVSETGLLIENEAARLEWMNDQLYVFSETTIYKTDGKSVHKLASIPADSGFFHVTPFLYDGQLTTVIETFDKNGLPRDDEFRLVHLVDGKWVNGHKMFLPGRGRKFQMDRKRNGQFAERLLPRVPVPPAGRPLSHLFLSVATRGQDVHLCFAGDAGFKAYRSGFEFSDDEDDSASALTPENSLRDVSGWESTGGYLTSPEGLANVINDPNDILVSSNSSWNSVVVRMTDSPSNLVNFPRHAEFSIAEDSVRGKFTKPLRLLLDDADPRAYLVSIDDPWDSASFRRLEKNSVLPVLTVPGSEREYLAWCRRLIAVIPIAWALHLILVVIGTDASFRSETGSTYVFGLQQAAVASTGQRALALLIDAFLISTAALMLMSIQPWIFQTKWDRSTEREVCDALLHFENSLPGQAPSRAIEVLLVVFGLYQQSAFHSQMIAVGMSTVIALSCLKFYFEGRKGITPGKWLFGIRTVRSTLRPCGFARAIVRDALYWVDIPFFVTPLPAALCMILSPYRQRIGDRVADTIVIRAGSIQNSATVAEHIGDSTIDQR